MITIIRLLLWNERLTDHMLFLFLQVLGSEKTKSAPPTNQVQWDAQIRKYNRRAAELVSRLYHLRTGLHNLLHPQQDAGPRIPGQPEKEVVVPITPDEVRDMAEFLGLKDHKHLYWVAKQALEEPLPPDWEETVDDQGQICFLRVSSGAVFAEHPLDAYFLQLAKDEMDMSSRDRGFSARWSNPWMEFVDVHGVPYFYILIWTRLVILGHALFQTERQLSSNLDCAVTWNVSDLLNVGLRLLEAAMPRGRLVLALGSE